MPKSWTRLIILGLIFLLFITGYEIFSALAGLNNEKEYTVIGIEGNFDGALFNFLDQKGDSMRDFD